MVKFVIGRVISQFLASWKLNFVIYCHIFFRIYLFLYTDSIYDILKQTLQREIPNSLLNLQANLPEL